METILKSNFIIKNIKLICNIIKKNQLSTHTKIGIVFKDDYIIFNKTNIEDIKVGDLIHVESVTIL